MNSCAEDANRDASWTQRLGPQLQLRIQETDRYC